MSTKVLIMAGLAVAFGATSYFAGNRWLESQAEARLSEIESRNPGPAIELSNVVVAAAPLRFGEKLTAEKLKLVAWPNDARPEGSFATIEEVIADGERKAIKSIEPGEPVLAVKLTGENGRAGLAGIIAEGMRAVTIPVDMVNGVGGFVLPGDRVDIVLTRRDHDEGDQTAKIIMENIKVLSIDQEADSRADAPKVAQTVTLETDFGRRPETGPFNVARPPVAVVARRWRRGKGQVRRNVRQRFRRQEAETGIRRRPTASLRSSSRKRNSSLSALSEATRKIAHTVPILNPDEDATGNIRQ